MIGRKIVYSEPLLISLFSSMKPFNSSTYFFTNVNPNPVPSKERPLPSLNCLNGSQIQYCSSFGIPIPLSLTENSKK
jgi:hypothetical protein